MDNRSSQYDDLIRETAATVWPGLDWRLIKAQMQQESGFDADAVSCCGAQGLLQLMPGTAAEMGCEDPFDPAQNIPAGIMYLKLQYDHFPEIPDEMERLRYSLASYNAGRGTINKAIREEILDHGRAVGSWQHWQNVVDNLPDVQSRANARQTTQYVEKIMGYWQELIDAENV